MSEGRKNHLTIDGGQAKEEDHVVASYKPIPESDTDFRTSKTSIHKSKERLSSDGAEEKLLQKEEEAKIVTRVDMVDAKYAVGDHRNGDAKIELDANKRQFTGLTKEELMKYAEDPFWVRLRWFMFVLFWALWLCMLAGAVAIIVRAPKCSPPPPRTWYLKGPSVDMPTVEDYLEVQKDLPLEQARKLTRYEKGPLVDMSTVENYQEMEKDLPLLEEAKVSGIFAFACRDTYEVLNEPPPTCLEEFKNFALKAKDKGIKVIVDLTANFVSKSHAWFQQSENKSSEYSDFFVWAKSDEFDSEVPGQRRPPNNWVSTLNAPAWTFSEQRGEFYLHQFGEDQPDLNFNNSKVVLKFDAVIEKWMQAGAAGIRLHHARELLVDSSLRADVPRTGKGSEASAVHTQYAYWQHRGTRDLPQLDALLAHWAHRVASHAADTVDGSLRADVPRTGKGSEASAVHTQYAYWQHRGTRDLPQLDALLAHWAHRVASHAADTEGTVFTIAEESRPELFALDRNTTALRPPTAAPVSVQDVAHAAAVITDLVKMRWPALQLTDEGGADEELAAFALLLPAAPVLQPQQIRSKENDSYVSEIVSHVAALRQDSSLQHGQHAVRAVRVRNSTDAVLFCARWKTGHTGYAALYNPHTEEARVDLSALPSLPPAVSVYRASPSNTNYTTNTQMDSDDVTVPPHSSLVLSYVPKLSSEE